MAYEYTNTSEYSDEDVFAEEILNRISALYKRLGTAESSIKLTGDKIEIKVSEMKKDIGALESVITVQSEIISLKVSKTEYNGETIMSKIEQTAASIKLSASRIELDGVTHVNGNLELGKGWEPNGSNGAKRIRFANSGEIVYYDGFEYRSAVHGHYFVGDISFALTSPKYKVDFSNVDVKGLNLQVVFG